LLSARLSSRPTPANDNRPSSFIDAQTLLGLEFEAIKYVIPGYVAEGLTILGGRPKLGKSWLALDWVVAVASGGQSLGAKCEQGDAFYLALEDNQRRLQDRLKVVLPKMKSMRPDLTRLSLLTEAPKIGEGLIEALDEWRSRVDDPRLIVVDTLAMVRPPKGRNQDSYAADYAALSPLQQYASAHRLAVVVVTHVRKMEASDPLEMISGTNGLTGAADSIMVLDRTADGPKLYGRGRDVEEVEKALRFDGGKWSVLGNVDDVKRSDERRKIIEALGNYGAKLSPKDIAEATGMKVNNVNRLLGKMVAAGELVKDGYGTYSVLPGKSG
jgi:RecA-family ATPase